MKFVLSEFNVSFKPFVQASKEIRNGILKIVVSG
jgi:DNA-directed RNA polymerase subunit K/omega